MKLRPVLKTAVVFALIALLVPVTAEAQDNKKKKKKKTETPAEAVEMVTVEALGLYDRGAYDELIGAVDEAQKDGAQVNPDALYLQAQSLEAKKSSAAAGSSYSKLAALPDTDAWHFIGASGQALLAGRLDDALAAANQATSRGESNVWAHYQRGLVLMRKHDYPGAAAAFTDALEINGNLAYGHYWAGMSYQQTKNLVATANHLRRFTELALEAPERLQALGILATIQG